MPCREHRGRSVSIGDAPSVRSSCGRKLSHHLVVFTENSGTSSSGTFHKKVLPIDTAEEVLATPVND